MVVQEICYKLVLRLDFYGLQFRVTMSADGNSEVETDPRSGQQSGIVRLYE